MASSCVVTVAIITTDEPDKCAPSMGIESQPKVSVLTMNSTDTAPTHYPAHRVTACVKQEQLTHSREAPASMLGAVAAVKRTFRPWLWP